MTGASGASAAMTPDEWAALMEAKQQDAVEAEADARAAAGCVCDQEACICGAMPTHAGGDPAADRP